MILAQNGEVYPINRNGVEATINKSVDDIMAYVTNLGYNSFFLLNSTYAMSIRYYVIFPFNATLVNGDSIYLVDNPRGVSSAPPAGARADSVRGNRYNVNNAGNIQQASGSISWTTNTFYGTTYRTYHYDTYEPVFYTRLNYSHIFVNNEDVTPVVYNWQSVPSISGKNGILSLSVLIDTDGNPVSSGSASDFSVIPSEVKVRTLADANV